MEEVREFIIRCKNGKSKYIEFRTTFLKDQIISVLTDVTQRRKAEKDLRESEERLKAIFGANPDPVAVYNADGHPLYLNTAFIDVFGWTLEELQGKQIPFVPKDQEKLAQTKIREIYRTGDPVRFETKRFSKQGRIIDIFLSAAIIKDYKGMHNGLVVNLKDISNRKMLENQLQHAQKMEAIGTLAGGIAHDFNNMLFPIMGHTEILLLDTRDHNPTQNRLQKIYKGARRAKDLVRQILTFSRHGSVELQTMKLQPIVKEAISLVKAAMPDTVEIEEHIDDNCKAVKADSTQIHQIVMNLATNASHAMEENGGIIKVSLKEIKFGENDLISPDMKPGIYICLSIADGGSGMDEELIKQIFDPFFTTKEKGRGTGMGLATVHGIVKKMKGEIQVLSEPGKGAIFNIYFPAEKS
jgi:PAS domain S-box-containing protein